MESIERWGWIPRYVGYYQVSTKGRVKSFKRGEKIMRIFSKEGKYKSVTFHVNNIPKTEMIHQIMAETFLFHVPSSRKIVVDHIDGNKHNNVIENLQIISNRENTSKDKKKVSSKFTGVFLDLRSGKMQAAIRLDGKKYYIGKYETEIEASKKYNEVLSAYENHGLIEAIKIIISLRKYNPKKLITQLEKEVSNG